MASFLKIKRGEGGFQVVRRATFGVSRSQADLSQGVVPAEVASERVLVVDDEKLIRWSVRENLERAGYQVIEAGDGEEAIRILDEEGADLVLLDVRLPGKSGLNVLEYISAHHSQTPTVLMTAYSSVEEAVEAMKRGAFDYLVKPFNQEEALVIIRKALDTTRMQRELQLLRRQQSQCHGLNNLVGASEQMCEVCDLIRKVALSSATTVLLQGESGTGKDLAAKAIHYTSDRADKPFMNITCSALPETLLESELMGHERGAFTDARRMKRGLLELAEGGTVFLDEIGDMGLGLQAKLLRFLEEKTLRRVGGTRDIRVDVRIIAATNRELEMAAAEGRFREDLYYRLNVIEIRLPSLRDRPQDIPLLTAHFVQQFNKELRRNTRGFTRAAMECLLQYPWPGNVRELRNVVERAMILENKEELSMEELPPEIRDNTSGAPSEPTSDPSRFSLPDGGYPLKQMEEQMLRQALEKTGGNQCRAATLLNISRDALRYRMKKYGLL
jgi:DNA-binding NtrC family response regulator